MKGKRKVGEAGKRKALISPVSSRFIFLFALSEFSGPDHLGAWNRPLLSVNRGLTVSATLKEIIRDLFLGQVEAKRFSLANREEGDNLYVYQ